MGKNINIDEIQKDISEYISRKYGIKFKVAAFGAVPEAAGGKDLLPLFARRPRMLFAQGGEDVQQIR